MLYSTLRIGGRAFVVAKQLAYRSNTGTTARQLEVGFALREDFGAKNDSTTTVEMIAIHISDDCFVIQSYLLGLLAKIKCSICSYQLNI